MFAFWARSAPYFFCVRSAPAAACFCLHSALGRRLRRAYSVAFCARSALLQRFFCCLLHSAFCRRLRCRLHLLKSDTVDFILCWISIVPPSSAESDTVAALVCDSLHPRPFALHATELADFFQALGDRHSAAGLEPDWGERRAGHVAAEWSAYSVRQPP